MAIDEARPIGRVMTDLTVQTEARTPLGPGSVAMEAVNMSAFYGKFRAVKDVSLAFRDRQFTALI